MLLFGWLYSAAGSHVWILSPTQCDRMRLAGGVISTALLCHTPTLSLYVHVSLIIIIHHHCFSFCWC